MIDFFQEVTGSALRIIEYGGYFGIFALAFLDRVLVFIVPAEIVFPLVGFLIGQGKFVLFPALLCITVGNLLGNLTLYAIAAVAGRPFLERFGRYVFIRKHELDHADRFFKKYGKVTLLIAYLMPSPIRSLIALPAGVTRMPVFPFAMLTVIGSLPLNILGILFGMQVGEHWASMAEYIRFFEYAFLIFVSVAVIWYLVRHYSGLHATH